MVKITDVARHAGVSPSTVSYALSGKRPISEATRQRIHASIRELGYRPHAGARALAGSRTRVLALMTPLREGDDIPGAMRFAAHVVTAARRHDHDVLLLTQEEGEEGLRRIADSAMADGIILVHPRHPDTPTHPPAAAPYADHPPAPGPYTLLPLLRTLALPWVLTSVPPSARSGELANRCLRLLLARLDGPPRGS
jgi:DNA-binding LacI/PurR family transcriptional regulator